MSDEIYILKDDLVKYCEKIAGVGESYFDEDFLNELNKIIEQVPVFKEKYVNRDIIDLILDVAFEYTDHFGDEYDEIADNLKTFPCVRFVNAYEKEIVYREDIISSTIDASVPDAKVYKDDYECYSTNEITIYWNSALIHLLYRLDK